MDAPTTITARFLKNGAEVLHAVTLKDAAAILLAREYKRGEEPLLLELEQPAGKLFFQAGTLRWYITARITYDEAFEALWCDGLYRNKTSLVTQNEDQVEQGSLWMLRGDALLLINEDDFISCSFAASSHLFEDACGS